MDVVWALLFFAGLSLGYSKDEGIDGQSTRETNEKKSFKVELFPPNPTYAGQTRMPRTFFKKLHSGASFLAGLKLGTILSKKGFELGHGKIASTHSFQIFGKSVNSAMSLAYGDVGSLLPLVNDVPESEEGDSSKRTTLKKEEKKTFRVTVIENPYNETVEKLQVLPSELDNVALNEITRGDFDGKAKQNVLLLYEEDSAEDKPEDKPRNDFFEEHNKRVKEFNDGVIRRKNSKF